MNNVSAPDSDQSRDVGPAAEPENSSTETNRSSSAQVEVWAEKLLANPWVAYGAIFLLQMKILWGIWDRRDLNSGDTMHYFRDAAGFAYELTDNVVWSPLYTSIWGAVLRVFGLNPVLSSQVYRMLIVLSVCLLVLTLTRQLLRPGPAFLVAVWWTVLPTNFNPLYEVHPFGLIPLLVAAVLVSGTPSRRRLGVALAVLVGGALLVRNELVIVVLMFGVFLLIHEKNDSKRARAGPRQYGVAYGLPLVAVVLLCGAATARSVVEPEQIGPALNAKEQLNVCQSFAFNYKLRRPEDFPGNPFTECRSLMVSTFETPNPSMLDAARKNPKEVVEHVKWNARLLPDGLKAALFGEISPEAGTQDGGVSERSWRDPLMLTMLALLCAGILHLFRGKARFRSGALRGFHWSIVVVGSGALMALFVLLGQRPWPDYMYALTLLLMLATGASIELLADRRSIQRWVPIGAVLLGIVLMTFIDPFYPAGAGRPLATVFDRLSPFAVDIRGPSRVLVGGDHMEAVCSYLSRSSSGNCGTTQWEAVRTGAVSPQDIANKLRQSQASAVYLGPNELSDHLVGQFVSNASSLGWIEVRRGTGRDGPWTVLLPAESAGRHRVNNAEL